MENKMHYITQYHSPLGDILLAADECGLIGLWFEGQKYYANGLVPNPVKQTTPILIRTKQWLDQYFAGQPPLSMPPIHMTGTPFQLAVWEILQTIPYGKTTTYKEIAKTIAAQKGLPHMSAQAVGGAVGHNKISILIPCHRVVGTNGSLTGYAGGIDKKLKLLTLERADILR